MLDVNEKIAVLYNILVTNRKELKAAFIDLIAHPEKIEDVHHFGIVLTEWKETVFIDPLLLKLSQSEKGDPWLSDYLYAARDLIGGTSEDFEIDTPDGLLDKLETWVLDNTGELSWYAAELLQFYESERAEQIQLKKLEEVDKDFFLTYVACIKGLLRYDEDKYINLVREIATDEAREKNLREAAQHIVAYHDEQKK